jgi:transitional endoplasmic reticulum ATPase
VQNNIKLSPVQRLAFDRLLGGIAIGDVLVLQGPAGAGKSTILNLVHATMGGALLGMRQFIDQLAAREPMAIEEAFLGMLDDALAKHSLVIVDDLHLITNIVDSFDYPRTLLLDAGLTAVLGDAIGQRKKLVFTTSGELPWSVRRRAFTCEIGSFSERDYEAICRPHLESETAGGLDYAAIHRFAPALNAHQLKNACVWLRGQPATSTAPVIEYLKAHHLAGNVNLEEVPPVDWSDLKGVDDVIRALEAKIALPFENGELSTQLKLKPKRGVLLSGPPGTGKTTIGRALAHRLKGKFFLIDGTMISGQCDFYGRVEEIFKAAKQSAPSVIFIDDTDVILEDNGDRGFYRYLLTMLDGLESASAERVCVMMTAMNVTNLPQAVLRSGRVELWLETKLPDAPARAAILREKLAGLPAPLAAADLESLSASSRGLTGADLKAVVEDGKLLYAHDVAEKKAPRRVEEYFLEAIAEVRSNQACYARRKAVGVGPARFGFMAE